MGIAKISEVVFRAAGAFYLARIFQYRARLPHQIEGDVGDGDVLFQYGAVSAPFR